MAANSNISFSPSLDMAMAISSMIGTAASMHCDGRLLHSRVGPCGASGSGITDCNCKSGFSCCSWTWTWWCFWRSGSCSSGNSSARSSCSVNVFLERGAPCTVSILGDPSSVVSLIFTSSKATSNRLSHADSARCCKSSESCTSSMRCWSFSSSLSRASRASSPQFMASRRRPCHVAIAETNASESKVLLCMGMNSTNKDGLPHGLMDRRVYGTCMHLCIYICHVNHISHLLCWLLVWVQPSMCAFTCAFTFTSATDHTSIEYNRV